MSKAGFSAPKPVAVPLAQWAARFDGKPVAESWSGSCPYDANRIPHVHARRALRLTFNIDPATGRWLNETREASL